MSNAHGLGSGVEKKEKKRIVTQKPQLALGKGERDRATLGKVKNIKEGRAEVGGWRCTTQSLHFIYRRQ